MNKKLMTNSQMFVRFVLGFVLERDEVARCSCFTEFSAAGWSSLKKPGPLTPGMV